MSLSVPYENVHDAQMRLQNTIVLYDGEPVYIIDVGNVGQGDPKGDILRVYAAPLPYTGRGDDMAKFRKFISSKKFDMAPFPMGFMNLNGNAVYCSRVPRRQQRQGLSNGTFSGVYIGGIENMLPAERFENLLDKKEFVDCIKGKYPSYKECISLLTEGKASSAAFTRCYALVIDKDLPELIYLYHKKERVGFVMDNKVKLAKTGKCLRESLQEANVPC